MFILLLCITVTDLSSSADSLTLFAKQPGLVMITAAVPSLSGVTDKPSALQTSPSTERFVL